MLAGELPLRDFQAYDPARYFWSAAWMTALRSDGIVALRLGNAVLSSITVVVAAWAVHSTASRPGLALVPATGAIFLLWMVPPFKAADSFAVILLLAGLTALLRRPRPSRWFSAGLCWGVAATIGINHALYGAVGLLLAFLYLRGTRQPIRGVAAALAGSVVGYSPLLALHAFAPNFSAAFLDGIRLLFENGATNQALPFPSPSAVFRLPELGYLAAASELLSALIFLGAPVLWLWLAWRLRHPVGEPAPPVVTAAFILSLPYAHYAYSRADTMHVAISILPLLVLVLSLAMRAKRQHRRLAMGLVFLLSVIITAQMHPAYHYLRGHFPEAVIVGGDQLLVSQETVGEVRNVRHVARAAEGGAFFAGPYAPGAYALAGRKSPVWEIYMLFPARPSRQQAEIERLGSANVRHALVSEARADGRRDLGLAQTHPLLVAYIRRCMPDARTLASEPRLIHFKSEAEPSDPARYPLPRLRRQGCGRHG